MNLVMKFLNLTAWLFTSGVVFDYFCEYPMSMEANFILAVVIALIVVAFTAYAEKQKKNEDMSPKDSGESSISK